MGEQSENVRLMGCRILQNHK